MDKFKDLKSEYDSFLAFVKAADAKADLDAVATFYTAAILKIWGSNVLYSPDYATLLSTLTGTRYTIEQIVTAMGCCGDPERRLMVPKFFARIVKQDAQDKGHRSSDIIDKLNSLLVCSVMINGDFTQEEAACLSSIMDGFSAFAGRAGVAVPELSDYRLRITDKNEGSYLQNDALVSMTKQQKIKVSEKPPAPLSNDALSPVNITINLSSNDMSTGKEPDDQAVPDEEAPKIMKPAEEGHETMESLLAELDGLVGLENVKQDVHSLMNFIKVTKIREKRGMKVPTVSYHLVFTGNPGTGKTTVARLVAKLYYHMGILPQGQLVETDRSALVAGYLGQTAIKTQKVIQQAMGGVLFIDEAYSLAGETDDSYGKEAIETILKAMEDHRDELVVIVAGYTELMHKFIESNPGLSSRFSKYFEYPDYSGEELMAIFNRFCEKNGYLLNADASELLKQEFVSLYEKRDEHFGNARTARNIFEKTINAQANRVAKLSDISDADLVNITAADIASTIGGNA